jgi:hypothetical protein
MADPGWEREFDDPIPLTHAADNEARTSGIPKTITLPRAVAIVSSFTLKLQIAKYPLSATHGARRSIGDASMIACAGG